MAEGREWRRRVWGPRNELQEFRFMVHGGSDCIVMLLYDTMYTYKIVYVIVGLFEL